MHFSHVDFDTQSLTRTSMSEGGSITSIAAHSLPANEAATELSGKVSGFLAGFQAAVKERAKADSFLPVRADYSMLKAKFPPGLLQEQAAVLEHTLGGDSAALSFTSLRQFIGVIPDLKTDPLAKKDEQMLAIRLGRQILPQMTLTPDELCQVAADIADLAGAEKLSRDRHKPDWKTQVRDSVALTSRVRPANTPGGKLATAMGHATVVTMGYCYGFGVAIDAVRLATNLGYAKFKQDKSSNKAINWLCTAVRKLGMEKGQHLSPQLEQDMLTKCAQAYHGLGDSKKAKKLNETVIQYMGDAEKSKWEKIKDDVHVELEALKAA